jgi:hypothetical protein
MATVGMCNSVAAREIRMAISPLLAMSSFLIFIGENRWLLNDQANILKVMNTHLLMKTIMPLKSLKTRKSLKTIFGPEFIIIEIAKI